VANEKTAEFVTVACKVPNGLRLRLHTMEETTEQVMGGGSRKVKVARHTGDVVVINGNSHPQNAAPRAQIVDGLDNGYALTPNVPKAFWGQWLEQNKNIDMVRNGLVFAHDEHRSVEAEAREKKDVRSGMERLDPKDLPKTIQAVPSGATL
jgi:hypothetical protein